MRISASDKRSEDHNANAWWQADAYTDSTEQNRTTVGDYRTIIIEREDTDTDDEIPLTLNSFGYGRPVTFKVETIRARWTRSWVSGGWKGENEFREHGWKLEQFTVSGPQIKADGTLSHARRYNNQFPLTKRTGDYPHWKYHQEPLPAWVQSIVDSLSPVTGTPFLYGDTHTYGVWTIGEGKEYHSQDGEKP